jgi:hypothetical protein
MKSALFVQANVAVNTKLTSKKISMFLKKMWSKTCNLGFSELNLGMVGKFFRCPFQCPEVPLEAGAPLTF